MAWKEEHKERAESLAAQGLSASRVALKLNAEFGTSYSRNAIIGVIARRGNVRLGSNEGQSKKRVENRLRNAAVRKKKPVFGFGSAKSSPIAKPPMPLPVEEPPPSKRYTLFERPASGCKWFYGDPLDSPRGYCTATSVPGLPYCEFHVQKAYQVRPMKRVTAVGDKFVEPDAAPVPKEFQEVEP